eukprot:scaffold6503_cov360-Prasinococcus_capsulatus_cf.AAC.1
MDIVLAEGIHRGAIASHRMDTLALSRGLMASVAGPAAPASAKPPRGGGGVRALASCPSGPAASDAAAGGAWPHKEGGGRRSEQGPWRDKNERARPPGEPVGAATGRTLSPACAAMSLSLPAR